MEEIQRGKQDQFLACQTPAKKGPIALRRYQTDFFTA